MAFLLPICLDRTLWKVEMNRIVIFANGSLPDLDKARLLLREDDTIFCADGGTRHALALGLQPDLIIGDMDSLNRAEWQRLEQAGVPIELFPHEKDETDLELALGRALESNPASLLIVGALGLRLDQTLANLALLSDPRLAAAEARIDDGLEQAVFCRARIQIDGTQEDTVSLIPWGGPVEGVHTQGLYWPLRGETLQPHKTRGISNKMIEPTASVSVESGLLLVVHRRQT
jgi:thiamine pyrophosphokinase